MTQRDMTPDELERFEEDRVEGTDRPREESEGRADEDPLRDVEPGDEDGLPDGPARFRVPS